MSVGGLSSRTFLKNCLLFHLILCLKVLSVVRCSLSTSWGMNPSVTLYRRHSSLAFILLLCSILSSSSQYGTVCQHILAIGTAFLIASWCASCIASAACSNDSSVGRSWFIIQIIFSLLLSSAALKALLYSSLFALFQFGHSVAVSPIVTLLLVIVNHITT
jgi:hypothetical protein